MCGDGSKGQLGIGDCENVYAPSPVRGEKVKAFACGENHTLAVSSRGSETAVLKSTGANDRYQLGIPGHKRDHL